MKLVNVDLEKQIIRTLCSSNKKARSLVIASVKEDSFHYGPTKEAYQRVMNLAKKQNEIVTWRELITDPVLKDNTRNILKDTKTVQNIAQIPGLLKNLEKYRQIRSLALWANAFVEEVQKKSSVDPEKAIADATNAITRAQTGNINNEDFVTFGDKDDSSGRDLIAKLLEGSDDSYIPTGFKTFDNRNRGLRRKSLVGIGGRSGQGKSAMGQQMSINMALFGAKVCYISLEMDHDELGLRRAANLSGINLTRLIDPKNKMSVQEREFVEKKRDLYERKLAKTGGLEKYLCPSSDVDIVQVLNLITPFCFDVVIIDYMSLLNTPSGKEQWQQLGEATRYYKRWAVKNDAIAIFLAQLNEDNSVRYSRKMVEDCNNFFSWQDNGTNIMEINQQKARMQDPFTFQLKKNLETMQITDLTDEERGMFQQFQEKKSDKATDKKGKFISKKQDGVTSV